MSDRIITMHPDARAVLTDADAAVRVDNDELMRIYAQIHELQERQRAIFMKHHNRYHEVQRVVLDRHPELRGASFTIADDNQTCTIHAPTETRGPAQPAWAAEMLAAFNRGEEAI